MKHIVDLHIVWKCENAGILLSRAPEGVRYGLRVLWQNLMVLAAVGSLGVG